MPHKRISRQILTDSSAFKAYWKGEGPFAYALTSSDYPPVLLEPEEWLFSNDLKVLLKELMQYEKRDMKMVRAPFNPKNRSILRPDRLSEWQIRHFPEEWNTFDCDLFIPQGHLTLDLFSRSGHDSSLMDAQQVADLFFQSLADCLHQLGYLLLAPGKGSKYAAVTRYLSEWEKDDAAAGL